jgi:RNA polymerase sigma-70 factor (ECF subfamily)
MVPLSEAELEALYVKLEKPVYNVVYRWVWEREEARDIVQEAFVRLWKMRARVERGSAQPLVYKIATNLAASRLRWKKVRSWLPLDSLRAVATAERDAETAAIGDESSERLRAAIMALPADLRTTVLLTEFSELGHGEIATLLGVAPATVATRRHRAIARLRAALGEPAPETDDDAARAGADVV